MHRAKTQAAQKRKEMREKEEQKEQKEKEKQKEKQKEQGRKGGVLVHWCTGALSFTMRRHPLAHS